MKAIFIIQAILYFILIALANRWLLSVYKEELNQHKSHLIVFVLVLNLGLIVSIINPINALVSLAEYSSVNLNWNLNSLIKSSLMLGTSAIQIATSLFMAFVCSYSLFRENFVKSDSMVISGIGWVLFLTFSILCHFLFQNLPNEFLVTPSDFNFN